ncbi:hypothetical protein AZE42_13270 [Rhizopogon vesiculosus]|uniref:Fungal-type protein kinase domain-containing protein n=1 Tax=Rhizopogon vesiculosus TaxID=180088 RepID=A0A1J8Q6J1_9AGAM|nr:hypothetical protein AZE42_13270 [Rhizopogon vesiculosus]
MKSFQHNTCQSHDTLGQISAYVAAHLGAQFHCHIYSLLVVWDEARILRWDRSGTIVSEAISYNNQPHLVEFFARFSAASPQMRGHDTSVSQPTDVQKHVAAKALDLPLSTKLFGLKVPECQGSYIVAAPLAPSYTPPGHATRGFKAYSTQTNTVVFLKDTWRINLPEIIEEGLTYKRLNEASVPHILKCLTSGDIGDGEHLLYTSLALSPCS